MLTCKRCSVEVFRPEDADLMGRIRIRLCGYCAGYLCRTCSPVDGDGVVEGPVFCSDECREAHAVRDELSAK